MLWESCSFGYTEHNKIVFAIVGFFYDFIRFLELLVKRGQRFKNLIT
jgi:hypothetical protein